MPCEYIPPPPKPVLAVAPKPAVGCAPNPVVAGFAPNPVFDPNPPGAVDVANVQKMNNIVNVINR